jgi:hypothetical protein
VTDGDDRANGETSAEEDRVKIEPMRVVADQGRPERADQSTRLKDGPARPPRRPPGGELRRSDPAEPTTVEELER